MEISIHEHFLWVFRQDRERPVTAFCTSKLTDRARQKITQQLSRPDLPESDRALIYRYDLNRRTGALRAHGFIIV